MPPFHFAFFVRDLASTRRFYGDVLGCREGRSTDTWVDFDFFGSQISAHATGPVTPTTDAGVVDGVHVPMPHFGALLEWEQFQRVADRIRRTEVPVDHPACWAGLYEVSPDKHAILGPVPGVPNLFLINGSSGHGVMHAPALGRLLAEIVCDGHASSLDVRPLWPERFAEGDLNPVSELL